jgi:hypothetical protein
MPPPALDSTAGGKLPKGSGFSGCAPGYSDPIDEQNFVVTIINFLENPANPELEQHRRSHHV